MCKKQRLFLMPALTFFVFVFLRRVSAMTLGGISKASKGINLSEDIFGGCNFILRGGKATQAEYIQVGKGRDVGLGQITGFVAKISMGNGMQARSREVHRIAQQLDIFRLLSFFYSSVGFYLNQVFLTLSIWLFVYAKVYLVFDSRTADLGAIDAIVATVVSTEYVFQLGFMLVVLVLLVMAVESGLSRAIRKFVEIILRDSVLFFIFLSATNAYYVNKAFLTGEAKYMSTGRGFVIVHDRFLPQYCRYLQSHFAPAFEIMLLLIVYWHFVSKQTGFQYFAETFSVWLLVRARVWLDVIKDFDGWLSWMMAGDDDPDKSWHAWWIQQNAVFSFVPPPNSFPPFAFRSASGRLLGLLVSMALASAMLFLPVFNIVAFEQMLYFAGAVGFLLYFLVVQASLSSRVVGGGNMHKAVDGAGNNIVWNTYRAVHLTIGLVIMIPTMLVAFFPFMTPFQTRMMFNQNFSARFTSAKLFATERERQQARGWIAGDEHRRGGGGGSKGKGGGGSKGPPTLEESSGNGSPPPPQSPPHRGGHGKGRGAVGSASPPVRSTARHDAGRNSRTKAA
ncbi:GT48 [Ectocarpus sp. CCAP 1310/34]|nr:GT48 [Ectocarpus sp. CCAP 1310/34]